MREFSLLFKYNLLITAFLFTFFLIYNNEYTLLTFILCLFAAISSAVILYLVLYIVFVLFSFFGKIGLYFISVGFVFVDIVLILDFFIFRLYNFHINAMVINILTSPAAVDSIQIGIWPLLLIFGVIFLILLTQVFLIQNICKKDKKELKKENDSFFNLLFLPLLFIVLVEKFSYGFASLYSKNEVLNAIRVIPLYQPLTFNRLAAKYFDFKYEKSQENTISETSPLNYPLKDIEFSKNLNKTNIFIIASDSVAFNSINKEISPNIEKFKEDSIVFNNHYSGGNSTRFGIFSLLYGINSTYWFSFLNSQKGSVFFDVLKKLDYNINIISSTNTSWPEFRKTAYVNVQDNIFDKFDGVPWEKDKQSSQKMLDLISDMNNKIPQFSFLFLDAPHGYSYPKEKNIFNAKNEKINYLTIKKDSEELDQVIATYKNSVAYNDMLFSKIIKELKEKNLYNDSIIIFTSDHGKEFFEFGHLGHNSSFSKYQTKVPLLIKLPSGKHKEIDKLTSHVDIVPTLLSHIGINNDVKDYSNGDNLLDVNFKRNYVFSANWNNNAIITNTHTYVFSNLPNKMFKNEIRDNNTYKKVDKNNALDTTSLLSIINENKQFFK